MPPLADTPRLAPAWPQADLMAHLAAIKDYFLMAKGELYHSFLVDARK